VRIAIGGVKVPTADVLELLDMADGNYNRAINMYLNRSSAASASISAGGGIQIPLAQPVNSGGGGIQIPVAQPVHAAHPPPPPSAATAPPLDREEKVSTKGTQQMEFKARSYAANEDFGFPENVILSLQRGHFTVLDEEGDDLAAWPMAHVHDWSATGKHDVEVHVPEGTLEFGMDDPEKLLSKLSIIHAALSGQ
jgi:hypothetical protein